MLRTRLPGRSAVPDDRKSAPTKPWERRKPRRAGKRTPLTAAQKKAAKARAEEAGRAYPNLVDNIWASRQPK
jgi:hypothetical protein